MDLQYFLLDKSMLECDLLLHKWLLDHMYQDMDPYICYASKPYLGYNQNLKHIQGGTLHRDYQCIQSDIYIRHYYIQH